MGTITLAVSVYNKTKEELDRCVMSLLDYDGDDIQILLVDDGSDNGIEKHCDRYASMDNRVRVIHQVNQGLSGARNTAIDASNSTYICFIDADDYLEKGSVEKLKKILGKYRNLDMLMFCAYFRFETGNVKDVFWCHGDSRMLGKVEIKDLLVQAIWPGYGGTYKPVDGNAGGACGKLYRVEFLRMNHLYFDRDIKLFEDVVFNFEAFSKAKQIYYSREKLYNYVIIDGSMCRTFDSSRVQRQINSYDSFKEKIDRLAAEKVCYDALTCRKEKGLLSLLRRYCIGSLDEFKNVFGTVFEYLKVEKISDELTWKESVWWFLVKHRSPYAFYYLNKFISGVRGIVF